MENKSDIVCGQVCVLWLMTVPLFSTGKSTLCCNISITQQTNKEKMKTKTEQNKKQKKKLIYLHGKQFWDCFMVCVPLRMTLPVLENQPYAIIFWLHNEQQYLFRMENCLYASRPSACARHWWGTGRWLQGTVSPCLRKYFIIPSSRFPYFHWIITD